MNDDAQELLGCGGAVLLIAIAIAIVLWAIRKFMMA